MTVKQAAAILEVSDSLVYELCRLGRIRHVRHGRPGRRGTIRIDNESLAEYRKASEGVCPALTSFRHIRPKSA